MRPLRPFCITLISLAGPASIPAQTAITTDRPGFAFSATTVLPNWLPAELGLPLLDFGGTPDDPTATVPAAVRYGLMEGSEARLSTVYFVRSPGETGRDGPNGCRRPAGGREGGRATR
jgi:hypothetical protein